MDHPDTPIQEASLEEPSQFIRSYKPNVEWDNIVGLDDAKEMLQSTILLPIRFPHLFRRMRRVIHCTLIYGSSGAGKSYLAEAIATKADQKLHTINMARIMSDSENKPEAIRKVFQFAKDQKPSIVLLEEIDAIYGKADGESTDIDLLRDIKVELLIQTDGIRRDDGIFVLATTCRPWVLDGPVRKRFVLRIDLPLPDQRAREQLLNLCLAKIPTLADKQLLCSDLAIKAEGQTRREISETVQGVLANWLPDDQSKDTSPLFHEIREALMRAKPSVNEEELGMFADWTLKFGPKA